MKVAKFFALIGIPLLAFTTSLTAKASKKDCPPAPAAPCNPSDCCRKYCLGPDNIASLAAVGPRTCNGDIALTIAGFYWNAHQDGMEYAIQAEAVFDPDNPQNSIRSLIFNGDMKNPNFRWNFGFKLGLGYVTACDGWDLNLLWTNYSGKASSHNQAELNENQTLLPLWTDFNTDDINDYPLYATDITTRWNLGLNLVDLELGRASWFSKRLSIRPHIGIRFASIKQDFHIQNKGGSFSSSNNALGITVNDFVELENNFNGVGARGGLDTVWNLNCGWGIYGNIAFSIIYGRFEFDQNEYLREVNDPFNKEKVIEAQDHFRTSRYMTDVAIGLRYATQFCECKYALAVLLGWEHHLFLNQNQMWLITRNLNDATVESAANIYQQRRGDLDTQGWTLTFKFDF